jgi:hypothetical protein
VPKPFVQPSIIATPSTPHGKAIMLLNELLPVEGSRCLRKTVWDRAAGLGVPKRAVQLLYSRLGITSLNDASGQWLKRIKRVCRAVTDEEEARRA